MARRTSFMVEVPLVILACATATAPVRAECEPGWWPSGGISGLDGPVSAVVAWDPDGDGPQPKLLVVGGGFSHAGSVEASHIATWDGEHWGSLGADMAVEGQYDYVELSALAVYSGELYVGGHFDSVDGAPAAGVARWDGTNWQPVGTGLRIDEATSGRVNALLRYGGELIAAGDFRYAGDVAVAHIARWDGRMWRPLGPGLDGTVAALTIHEGKLIVGGGFTTAGGLPADDAASWNGATWQPLGVPGPAPDPNEYRPDQHSRRVSALLGDGGDLIAGITSTSCIPYEQYEYWVYVARWNGTAWERIDGWSVHLFSQEYPIPGPPRVEALCRYNDRTYVGGTSFGLCSLHEGSEWDEHGVERVSAMSVHDGELIVGGSFGKVGDIAVGNIARWDGTIWRVFGDALSAVVNALTSFKGELIAGGDFIRAGNVDVNHVARWDGTNWQPLGAGLDGPVYAFTIYGGDLIVGGEFTVAGDVEARSIARWDGSQWTALGSGVDGVVRAFAEYGGALIVGGHFASAGDLTAKHIAQWDGSAWGTLQTGLYGTKVNALAVYNGELIAAGDFDGAYAGTGVFRARCLARWDGANWRAFEGTVQSSGSSVGACPYALTVYNDELIVGGNFKHVDGIKVMGVARWDGSSWHKLGTGFEGGDYYPVRALAVYGGELIAGGEFQDMKRLARWDGTEWHSLGGGMSDNVLALTIHHCDLIVGGEFTTTGANASAFWARWGSPCDANCPETDVPDDVADPNAEQDAPPAPVCPLAAGTLVTLTVVGLVRSRRGATSSHRRR